MELFLVRHAMPEIDPGAAPESWPLSPGGRLAASALRHDLPWPAVAIASPETKAVETLGLAMGQDTSQIVIDEGFREIIRPGEPFDDDVASRRLAWVEGRRDRTHDGWESPVDAATRFQQAIDRHRPPTGPMILASHGMVITAWLSSVGHVSPGDSAGAFWSQLRFPDVVRMTI